MLCIEDIIIIYYYLIYFCFDIIRYSIFVIHPHVHIHDMAVSAYCTIPNYTWHLGRQCTSQSISLTSKQASKQAVSQLVSK